MFEAIGEFFINTWSRIVGVFETINVFSSILDVALLALLFYAVLRLVRDSRAEQLLKGLLFLFLGYMVALLLNLKAVSFVLQLLFGNALILLVVIFQPELRRILERMGHSRIRFSPLNAQEETIRNTKKAIDAVCEAGKTLQSKKMGALIVFERKTMLGDVAATGTVLDADCSPELVGNLFFNKAPLHDGAVIIREGRVLSAGCILPLTDNLALSSELGTRHRAAVGISENSDAVVVVISEETGALSLAVAGTLRRDYTPESLQAALEVYLLPQDGEQTTPAKLFKHIKNISKGGKNNG